jgi:hypothetical protein
MPQKLIVGIGGSPRKGGNTDTLLQALLRGAAEAGARNNGAAFGQDFIAIYRSWY